MKLIFTFLTLLFYGINDAQTIEETIDWFNTQKNDDISVESYSVPKNKSNTITFSNIIIRIDGPNSSFTSIGWETINDFRINETNETPALYIVSSYIHEGLLLYIKMDFPSTELRDRFKKAFMHIVSKKSNDLVNSYSTEKRYTQMVNLSINRYI